MEDYLEIQFWRIAKWLIRRGYGADSIYCGEEGRQEKQKKIDRNKADEMIRMTKV